MKVAPSRNSESLRFPTTRRCFDVVVCTGTFAVPIVAELGGKSQTGVAHHPIVYIFSVKAFLLPTPLSLTPILMLLTIPLRKCCCFFLICRIYNTSTLGIGLDTETKLEVDVAVDISSSFFIHFRSILLLVFCSQRA